MPSDLDEAWHQEVMEFSEFCSYPMRDYTMPSGIETTDKFIGLGNEPKGLRTCAIVPTQSEYSPETTCMTRCNAH